MCVQAVSTQYFFQALENRRFNIELNEISPCGISQRYVNSASGSRSENECTYKRSPEFELKSHYK